MDKEARAIFADQLINKKYEKGITLITPSGERHEAIKQTCYYIERFNDPNLPIQWILSDDSSEHYTIDCPNNIRNFIHQKRKYPGDKSNSFRCNLITALPHILYNKIVIIEDDDWYHPDYLKYYSSRLDNYQLVGEGPAHYYNVKSRTYRVLGNNKRASFCQTALRTEIINKLLVSCYRDSAFVDARLWDKSCRKFIFQDDKPHCIGIKGMPGRTGIGIGHRMNNGKKDPDLKILKKWIGSDAEYYAKFFKC